MLIVNNFLSDSIMEMNAVHVGSLREPGKEFPKAIFLAMGLVNTALSVQPTMAKTGFAHSVVASWGEVLLTRLLRRWWPLAERCQQ